MIKLVATNGRYHLQAGEEGMAERRFQSKQRVKSPAKTSSIVNKKEHTRTDTKTKKGMDTGIHSIYTTRGAR